MATVGIQKRMTIASIVVVVMVIALAKTPLTNLGAMVIFIVIRVMVTAIAMSK